MPGALSDQGLDALFRDGGAGRSLGVRLPPGRLVAPCGEDVPVYWLSDAPVDAGVWAEVRRAHAASGLWPLLAEGLSGEPERPWGEGEVRRQEVADIDAFDAAGFLAEEWRAWREYEGDELGDLVAPFGHWPGLARSGDAGEDPDELAERLVAMSDDGEYRLLLVPAERGADTLTAAGWEGPLNHSNDMAPLSAVLRSWEDRFGVRVVRIGFDTLVLTVAAPPTTMDHARRVAAEHFVFCPDNIRQGTWPLERYAEQILGQHAWGFWWD